MPVSNSGRVVIEMDPELKQRLYASLKEDGTSLRRWFLSQVDQHLRYRHQLALDLEPADHEQPAHDWTDRTNE